MILNSLVPVFALILFGSLLKQFRLTNDNHFKLSLIAATFKLLVLPVTGFLFLSAFGVSGLALKVGLIYFTLPTSRPFISFPPS